MPSYYLNRTPLANGAYQVHALGCPRLPLYRIHLGEFVHAADALHVALRHYARAEACPRCAAEQTRR
ncbi:MULTISPECIES: hypothetical protein [unclassified Lysobacter]|uniref:hypothetical protein n=1 Tax=unclassified Lysobacter TaxID=2635362 RepID=UPI000700955B|nr:MULTISPECIES: hypothetical protein [unclassified Lysobacter]KQZ57488.1 hypothetical protein ASD53_07585 [Lysobacter sp. Root559]KRA79692.1 hypothetical protein ASD78_19125 [Lysobacter sp. Root667]KRC33637.1 hypothetical protein ASE10_11745 [Lysobacter sp. Root76]KRD68974.1 hypothetical protein ASE45_07195 [Lysobacter sp. Root96]